MQWREALDEARAAKDGAATAVLVAEVAAQVAAQREQVMPRLARLLDELGDYTAAAAEVRALMFLDKLGAECRRLAGQTGEDMHAA